MAAIAGAGIAMAARNAQHVSFWMDMCLFILMMLGSICITAQSLKDILRNFFWMWIVIPIMLFVLVTGGQALWHLIM